MDFFANCCRLCRISNDGAEQWNHLFAPHNGQLVKQIRSCTGVQISEGDPLPKWICDACMTALDQAYCFRIQCKETDICWRTQLTLLQKNVGQTAEPAPPSATVPLPVALVYVRPEVGEIVTEEQSVVKEEPVDEVTEEVVLEEPDAVKEGLTLEPEEDPKVSMSTSKSKPEAQIIHDDRRNKDSSWNKRLQCRFCPKNFGRMCRLREHEKRHTSERTVECLNCSSKFFTEADMRGHVERLHATDLPYGCDKCGKRFLAKGQLKNHALTHTERRDFTCEVCHKSFKNKYYLKYHVGLHEKSKRKSLEDGGLDQELDNESDEQTLPDNSVDGDSV